MTENEEKVLQEFMLDIDCLNLLDDWSNKFNLFYVLKITNAEIRHSNILSWLLNPNETHKLGDLFLKAFINNIIRNSDKLSLNLLMQDFYSYSVVREYNHIDLILVSKKEKTAYVIENKIWASESKHQLQKYFQKSQEMFKDYNIIYAFLTPDGHDSSDSRWIPISYEDIVLQLENVMERAKVDNDVRMLINNYINIVRKDIMNEKDETLIKICNEIYDKHREALNLIFQNVNLDKSIDGEIICRVIREYAKNTKIVYVNDNSWHFFTTRMTNYLPDIATYESSWNTKWVYYYFFEKLANKLIIHLEIGGWGVPIDSLTYNRMMKLMEYSKSIGNRVSSTLHFRYKRLFTKSITIEEKNYEESLEKAAKKLIDFALENENKLFEKINENSKVTQ